jgi:hypothetical protein
MNKEDLRNIIIVIIISYIVLSLFSSMIKSAPIDNFCSVKVPYDYIVFDRLFCPIK